MSLNENLLEALDSNLKIRNFSTRPFFAVENINEHMANPLPLTFGERKSICRTRIKCYKAALMTVSSWRIFQEDRSPLDEKMSLRRRR